MAVAPPEGKLLVNKSELARILKCSLPTLNKLIDECADFPVVSRGSEGVEWSFDVGAVTEYIEARRQAEREDAQRRNEQLAQFSLPGIDDAQPGQPMAFTPAQRLAAARARLAERELAMGTGQLVQKSEVRKALTSLVAGLGRFLDTLPAQIGRRHGLPDEVIASMRSAMDDQRARFVAEMTRVLLDEGGDLLGHE